LTTSTLTTYLQMNLKNLKIKITICYCIYKLIVPYILIIRMAINTSSKTINII
jgi:hypothetical protein